MHPGFSLKEQIVSGNPRVAVIGSGYWGKNLVRVFHELGALELVCDVRADALEVMQQKYGVRITQDYNEVLADKTVSAVVIAAPAVQHYELAKKAMLSGKDAYVEKPLALRVEEGKELVEIAKRTGRILMVGHILEYHPAIIELKRMIREGELGKVQYIYSSRLNLGKLRTEENILWSFAPHDISAILSLLGEFPDRVSAHGAGYLNSSIMDATLTTCEFRSGVQAHIFVSWLHPFKEQKLTIVADRMMAVFNDADAERKLVIYPHRIDWKDRQPVATKGEPQVVPLPATEPLKAEAEHFLECIGQRMTPRTDGTSALRVLQVLNAGEQSLRQRGQPIELDTKPKSYYAHPSAVIDEPCEIGNGTKIWHFSHVMTNSKIGEHCNLGQNVVISPDVTIGNNVKIQNNVSVYTGVVLEDDVFCGPSMVFTNVVNPRSHVVRRNEYRQTLVKRGASFGANCTVVCGHTVGEYAFIAAGAVVAKDVPAYALMAGVPARRIGWMCNCGIRLAQSPSKGAWECSSCGRQYQVSGENCVEAIAEVAAAKL